jgi:uncharacterized protein
MTHALYLYGGYPGHSPYEVARWARRLMHDLGFSVRESQDPCIFESEDLTRYDLIVVGWTSAATTEILTAGAEQNLLAAVRAGTGVAGWHGMTAAFRSSLAYNLVVGGAFVDHPGATGEEITHDVRIVDRDHPITQGVNGWTAATEQYYMHVDPSVHVLASSTLTGGWLPPSGVEMPAAYVRTEGKGRVFYVSVGHYLKDLQIASVERMVRQGMSWAARV